MPHHAYCLGVPKAGSNPKGYISHATLSWRPQSMDEQGRGSIVDSSALWGPPDGRGYVALLVPPCFGHCKMAEVMQLF